MEASERPAELRLSRGARASRYLRLRLSLARHVARRLAPPLALTALYTLVAALVVRWDARRAGAAPLDWGASLYGMYTQMFFEPTLEFPATPVSRAVFWITPVFGAMLIAQGIVKVGSSLLDRDARIELWTRIVNENLRDHVVMCGLGHVGFRVAQELRAIGEELTVIEIAGSQFVDEVRAWGVPVHVGDARRDELLRQCNVAHAKAIVCATSDDLANLEIAIDAKRENPKIRVIMRMFDQRLAAKVGGALELDASFSTSALAAPIIALQATQAGVHSAYRIGESMRVTADAPIRAGAPERAVSAIEAELPCRVVGLRRAGEAIPGPVRAADVARGGDVLVIDVAHVDLAHVRFRLGN